MNRVLYVPEEQAAREQEPAACLFVEVSKNPRRHDGRGKRRLTVPQAERVVASRGWVRLDSLPPAERRRWREAHRNARRAP